MKNTFIIALFLALGINPLLAQSSNRYDWGIEGGPNLSTFLLYNSAYWNAKPVVFGSAGFIFQHNLKKIISFKTGISYQRKGYQVDDSIYISNHSSFPGTRKGVLAYDYITSPFLIKASFGKKVKFFINAGPYVGFLLSRTKIWTTDTGIVPSKSNLGSYKRFDFGAAGGIGVTIPIKKSWMVHAEVRNYYGLQNMNDGGIDMYTNTTDLRLGVVYRLGFRE